MNLVNSNTFHTVILILFFFGLIFLLNNNYSLEKKLALADEQRTSNVSSSGANEALSRELISSKVANEKLNLENIRLQKEVEVILDEYKGTKKIAYLTFDDGPSHNTIEILNILDKHGIKASFFVNGSDSDFAKATYKEILRKGHTLGNHTYTHNYSYIYLSQENFFKDVNRLNDLIYNATGEKMNLLRFPGGSNNTISRQYGGDKIMSELKVSAALNDYVYFDWNVDSLDASASIISSNEITTSVLSQSKGNDRINILFHDTANKSTTVDALPKIITLLKAEGYEFKKLSKHSPTFKFN